MTTPGNFDSNDPNVPAVRADYSGPAGGYGILATGGQSNALTATTFSSTQIALVGANNSQDAAPAGPAGSGIFGLTFAPGGTGVFGANNSTSGRGVQGNGPDTGVGGFSDAGIAVFGQSTTGDGVRGTSVSGIAVHAFGPRAGVFVGGVEVTDAASFDGNITVAGVASFGGDVTVTGHLINGESDLTDQVAALFQQVGILNAQVASLQGEVQILQAEVASLQR